LVKWWERQREIGIKLTKFRIKHHEYHGNGKVAEDEKRQLKKQEKHHLDMKNK